MDGLILESKISDGRRELGMENMLRSLRPIHRNFWESNPQKARWEDLIFSMIHPWIMISGWIKWYANTGPNPSMLSSTNPLQICRLVNHYILKLGTWWDFFLFGNLGIPKTFYGNGESYDSDDCVFTVWLSAALKSKSFQSRTWGYERGWHGCPGILAATPQ